MNVVCPYNGILFDHKKEYVLIHATKWGNNNGLPKKKSPWHIYLPAVKKYITVTSIAGTYSAWVQMLSPCSCLSPAFQPDRNMQCFPALGHAQVGTSTDNLPLFYLLKSLNPWMPPTPGNILSYRRFPLYAWNFCWTSPSQPSASPFSIMGFVYLT